MTILYTMLLEHQKQYQHPPKEDRLMPTPLTPEERRQRREDYAAHGLAYLILLIFGTVCVLAVLGIADTREAAVASVVFSVMGYAAGKLDPVMARYFRQAFDTNNDSSNNH